MTATRIAVLMGGQSAEHDISLKTGVNVSGALRKGDYSVTDIEITRAGLWRFEGGAPLPMHEAIARLHALAPECVFPALHGSYGEDGRIQALLDFLDIPYVGSGVIGSGLSLDKVKSKAVARDAGIRVARDIVFHRNEWEHDADGVLAKLNPLGYPLVLKSPEQGSSLGMAIVQSPEDATGKMPELFEFGDVILAEAYLSGPEFTCGVLDLCPGQTPLALPVTELRPVTSTFFDYRAKYEPGATLELTPAEIPENTARKIQEMAVKVHRLMGCRHLSRSDMILADGEPVWLEVNTMPGMTDTSLVPQEAAAVGISFEQLVAMLVEAALGREVTLQQCLKSR